jgi:hypothetical protein
MHCVPSGLSLGSPAVLSPGVMLSHSDVTGSLTPKTDFADPVGFWLLFVLLIFPPVY